MGKLPKDLLELKESLKGLDAELRRIICPDCGKPEGGVVFAGQTKAQAGLCVCDQSGARRRHG